MEYNIPVVVPDLGCFIIVNIPSEFRDGKVIPPFKTVKLDSENTNDDGILTSYIARKENITIEQAAEEIMKFYHQNFKNRLPVTKNISFENFGTFSLNEYNNIEFKPVDEFFKENYGLGDVPVPGYAQYQPIAPEPEPIGTSEPELEQAPPEQPVPDVAPELEPIDTSEPEPDQTSPEPEPIGISEYEPDITPPEQPVPNTEDSLIDTSDSSRFRENTTRKTSRTFDIKGTTVQQTHEPKTNSSNLWVLLVLLAAALLGVAGYYFYPVIYQVYQDLVSPKTTITTVLDMDQEPEPLDTDEPEENTSDAELSQTLDEATDKKVVLNPEGSQQTEASPSPSQSPPQSTPAVVPSTPRTEPRPANIAQSQANAGQGRYVLIVASYKTHSAAEQFGRKLQTEGMNYEIISVTVNGALWNRVSIASFDTLDEATRQANQMKSRPYCQDVWVAKR